MNIKGKVAIVTGASSGIGEATAKLFANNGLKVALVARDIEKLNKLSSDLPGSIALKCDMTDPKQIKNMVGKVMDNFGRVDILINNAGQGYDADIEDIDVILFNKIIQLDLVGPLIAMQQVIPIMKKQKSGSIINISSGTALMNLPGMGAYASIKRALAHLSLTAREELAGDNINVGVVFPYITLTEFEKNTLKNDGENENYEEVDFSNLPHKPDQATYVAEIILSGIKNKDAQIFAHEWMKDKGR